MPARDLKVTLVGEDRTGKAFDSASKNADGLGGRLAGFAKTAALAFGGAAVVAGAFAKTGVDAFARIEDATGAAGVQFGKASADVVKFAQTASSSFGLSTGAALDAANTFGTMGKAAGLSGGDLAKFSTDFVGLAGDMASFKGTSPEQAIEAIGAALRGETEPIRAYGVLLDDASMRQEAMRLGLIKTTNEALTPQQKVLAAQSLIYKQTADAQGDFARTSDSTANTAKRLAAETENASARLGQQLAPAVTVAREAFLGLVKGASGLVTAIGPGLEQVMARARDLVSAMSAVASHIQKHSGIYTAVAAVIAGVLVPHFVALGVAATVNAAKTVRAWVATQAGAVKAAVVHSAQVVAMVGRWVALSAAAAVNAAKVVASWVATGAAAVRQAAVHVAQVGVMVARWAFLGAQSLLHAAKVAAAWLIAMGPIGLVIAGVVGLVAIVVKNWDTIREKTVALWEKVKQVTAATWDWIKNVVDRAVDFLVGVFLNFTGPGLIIKHWDTIKAATAAAWDWVKDRVRSAVDFVVSVFLNFTGPGLIIKHWDTIKQATASAWEAVKQTISNAVGAVMRVIDGIAAVPGRVGDWFRQVGGAAGAALNGLVDFIRGIPERVFGALGGLGDLARRVGDWFRGAGGAAGGALNGLVDFVRSIPGRVLDVIGGLGGLARRVGDWFRDAGGSAGAAMNGMVDFLRGIPGRVLGALGDLGGLLWGAGRSIIDGLIRGIESAFGRVRDLLGRLTGFLPDWKGPATRDTDLLYGAGRLVMGGFEQGLRDSFGNIRRALGDATDLIGMGVGGTGYVNARVSAPRSAGAPGAAAPAARNVTVNITGQVERLDEDRLMTLLARAERLAGVA